MYNGVPAFHARSVGPHMKTNRVGDVMDMIDREVLKKSGEFIVSLIDVLAGEPKIPAMDNPREAFHYENAVLINHVPMTLDGLLADHKGNDPQVDVQFGGPGGYEGHGRGLPAGRQRLRLEEGPEK